VALLKRAVQHAQSGLALPGPDAAAVPSPASFAVDAHKFSLKVQMMARLVVQLVTIIAVKAAHAPAAAARAAAATAEEDDPPDGDKNDGGRGADAPTAHLAQQLVELLEAARA
jgi:hypothetical protein